MDFNFIALWLFPERGNFYMQRMFAKQFDNGED